jgi:hypothetical protein
MKIDIEDYIITTSSHGSYTVCGKTAAKDKADSPRQKQLRVLGHFNTVAGAVKWIASRTADKHATDLHSWLREYRRVADMFTLEKSEPASASHTAKAV